MRRLLLASTVLAFSAASAAVAAQPAVCSSRPAYGVLPLANGGVGQIHDAQGRIFVPRGVGIMEGQEQSAATLQANMPGLNFVRYAIYDYKAPAALAPYVTSLTNAGIVVEIENHSNSTSGNAGGGQGVIFTGSLLQQESGWYSAIATYFKANPRVWFGTNNEPSERNANGHSDPAALSSWQVSTYQAIRNAGNDSPILLELNGGADPASMGQGYAASAYAQMYNVIWDMHVYGWLTNMNTDQAANDAFIASAVKQAQKFTSSGGMKIPVLIGEYGNSTTGVMIDANGTQIVQAVHKAVLNGTAAGSAAWAYAPGNPGDGLVSAGGGLSAYGRQVASYLAQAPAMPAVTSTATSCSGAIAVSSSAAVLATPATEASTADNGSTGTQQDVSNVVAASNAQVQQAVDQADAIVQQATAALKSGGSQ